MHETNFFKGDSPIEEANTSKHKPIITSKGRMYIVDSGASLHVMVESSLTPQETENHTTDQHLPGDPNRKPRMAWSVPLARRRFTSRISAPTFYWKSVEDSTSELSLRRVCDELEYSYSWQPGRNTTLTKGKVDNHALYRQFRFSRRSHSAKSYSICQARARQGKPLRQTQKWRKLV